MSYQFQVPPAGTLMGKTTLAAAITTRNQTQIQFTTTSITVGPYTTVTATNPQWALIIDGEIMEVVNPTPTTAGFLNVTRGQAGTAAQLHGKGAIVWAAPINQVPNVDPMLTGAPPPFIQYYTANGGFVAYASLGTSSTVVAGTLYTASIDLPRNFVATGLANLNGTTATTDKSLLALYDEAGNFIAASALAGATVSSANTYQTHAFSPGPIFVPVGKYYIVYQQNGTTATPMLIPSGYGFDGITTTSSTGTFGVLPASITVPSTFTTVTGAWAYIY